MNKLLIVSALRSGTSYTTKIFNTLGLQVSHDFFEGHDHTMKTFLADVEITGWSKALLVNPTLDQQIRTAAQFRNPLKVVQSTLWSWQAITVTPGLSPINNRASVLRQTYLDNYKVITGTAMPEGIPYVEEACRYIYESFRQSAATAEVSYRVENLHNVVHTLLEMMDARIREYVINEVFTKIPHTVNSKQAAKQADVWHQQLQWKDMPSYFVDLAEELGYDTKNE